MFYLLSIFTSFGIKGQDVSSGDFLLPFIFGAVSAAFLITSFILIYDGEAVSWLPSLLPDYSISLPHAFVFLVFLVLFAYRVLVARAVRTRYQENRFRYYLAVALPFLAAMPLFAACRHYGHEALSTAGLVAASALFVELMALGHAPSALLDPARLYAGPGEAPPQEDFGFEALEE